MNTAELIKKLESLPQAYDVFIEWEGLNIPIHQDSEDQISVEDFSRRVVINADTWNS